MDLPLIDRLRGFVFDLVHNVDTFRPAPIDDFDVIGDNKHFGMAYRTTMPKSLRTVLNGLPSLSPDTTFVDIGSGKGCTLLVASRFSFKKIIGVEFATELCQIARKNISSYRGSQACTDISVVQMDATQFRFPDGPLLIYFFNPFHRQLMENVLDNLRQSLAETPRQVTLVGDASYHKEAIVQILRLQQIDRICGFSIYAHKGAIA